MKDKKTLMANGLKFMAIAMLFILFSPVVITIGYKAIRLDDNYIFLIIGCVLAGIGVFLAVKGLRIILKALFS